jgi:NAD(P)-dependent dehydrogenase (short-subunit alcohol dehydrogenase family)
LIRPGGFASITDDDWQASWDLNVMATVRPTRAALPEMERRGGGSIVIVGSVNAYLPLTEIYDYSATKAAVTNFTKKLSKELAPKNIRVNSVSPGPVSTGLWTEKGRGGRRVRQGQRSDRRRRQDDDRKQRTDGPFHHFRTSRRPLRLPGQRSCRKHHWIRLSHRRRVRHHLVIRLDP